MDRNLLHISYEAGILENPWFDPTSDENKDMFKLTVDPADAPNEAEYVELDFDSGDCVAVNGEKLSPGNVFKALNALAGKHGIGRVDIVENRFVGMKSRGVYETPGGTILLNARKQMETLTLDRDLEHLRDSLISKYGELIYNGFWYSPERMMLQALIDTSQECVEGKVRLKLYKGNVIVTGRQSDSSLYSEELVTFEDDAGAYDQEDAHGFIRLNALRLRTLAARERRTRQS